MRLPFSACLLLFLTPPLLALPPANDNFASRITLSGASPQATGSNEEATEEDGENLQQSLFGATVWWTWTAPAAGWVRIDTEDSSFDTVLQISTGAAVASQTVVAFNDQGPYLQMPDASSITFLATAGTVYNIAVGGWGIEGPDAGSIKLNFTLGAAATPPWYPATVSFSPVTADVTSAEVPVTASFTIAAVAGASYGKAGIGFGWERNVESGDLVAPAANWFGSTPQAVLQQSFTVPRFTAPGAKGVWLKIMPSVAGNTLIFSSPSGGSGYALPPAVTQALTVANTGPVDEYPPSLTAFSLNPVSADVTTASATLPVSATLTDAPAGVEAVEVTLSAENAPLHLTALLTLTSGTAQSGTWTGNVSVPKLYPTGNYSVLVYARDVAHNDNNWGSRGTTEIPGGDVTVAIVGGSAYETWGYTTWFNAGDPNTGLLEDADGDGKPNLISYAFDLNPRNIRSSTGSLPVVEMIGAGPSRKLRITYIRREAATDCGLTYQTQFSSSANGIWETVTGGTAVSIGDHWERVTVEDTVTIGTEGRRFGRVKVEYTAP